MADTAEAEEARIEWKELRNKIEKKTFGPSKTITEKMKAKLTTYLEKLGLEEKNSLRYHRNLGHELVYKYGMRVTENKHEEKVMYMVWEKPDGSEVKTMKDGTMSLTLYGVSKYGCNPSLSEVFQFTKQDKMGEAKYTCRLDADVEGVMEPWKIHMEDINYLMTFLNETRVRYMADNYSMLSERYFNTDDKVLYEKVYQTALKTESEEHARKSAADALYVHIMKIMHSENKAHNKAQHPNTKVFPTSTMKSDALDAVSDLSDLYNAMERLSESGEDVYHLDKSLTLANGCKLMIEAQITGAEQAEKRNAKQKTGKKGKQGDDPPKFYQFRTLRVTTLDREETLDAFEQMCLNGRDAGYELRVMIKPLSNNTLKSKKSSAAEVDVDMGMHTIKVFLCGVTVIQRGNPVEVTYANDSAVCVDSDEDEDHSSDGKKQQSTAGVSDVRKKRVKYDEVDNDVRKKSRVSKECVNPADVSEDESRRSPFPVTESRQHLMACFDSSDEEVSKTPVSDVDTLEASPEVAPKADRRASVLTRAK